MSTARRIIPEDTPNRALSPKRSPRFAPLLQPVAEEILTPDEVFNNDFAEIKEYVKAHGWDAAAMFFGTAVYMGVYYAGTYFRVFGGAGRYIVHNLAMGAAANLAAMPFVKRGRLHEGKTHVEASRDAFRYFLLCTVPDSLYQPVEDWFIAICASGSMVDFEFIQDAAASFSPVEIGASFALFGVGFGLLYLIMKKLLIKHDAAPGVAEKSFDDWWHNFYKNVREALQTPTWESIKSAIQYFIFYLSDYLFDLNMNGVAKTLLNLFGCCALMAGYSFLFDNLPEIFGYLEIKRAHHLSVQLATPIDEDYVAVTVEPDLTNNEDFIVIGNMLDKLVEQRKKASAVLVSGDLHEALISHEDAVSLLGTDTTETMSSYSSSSVDLPSPPRSESESSEDLADDDDLEIIHTADIPGSEAENPLVSRDPNNMLPYSAQLLNKFRSIVSPLVLESKSSGLPSNAIVPLTKDVLTVADSKTPYRLMKA